MKSLNKVLDILEVFLEVGNSEIRLSELSRRTGINKATVYHIVSVLSSRGYMGQVERRGKYVLGPKFLNYSAVIKQKNRIRDIAMPHLVRLNEKVGEAASLFSWDGEMLVFVDEVHSKYPLRISPDPTSSIPLYCTSVGKIALTTYTDQELERYFNGDHIRAHTANTITDLTQFKKHLKNVAKEGVAYDDEENYTGVRAVAAGIRDGEEKLAGCISILGPSFRVTLDKLEKIKPEIKYTAMQISIDMGYRDK